MGRVLYISQGYCTHDRRFLQSLTKAGHEMWFVACEAAAVRHDLASVGSAIHWLRPLSDERLSFGTPAWTASAQRLREVVRRVSPDLVHAGPIPTGGYLAALTGFHPLLVMSWGSDVLSFPDKWPGARSITEFALKHADMAIADCEAVRKRIAALGGLPFEKIVCLPWGVDLKSFRPKVSALGLRRRLGWAECKVIISVRALEPIHEPRTFLQAIAKVLSMRSDVRVVMLGDGSLRPEVELFIQENSLLQKVHLAGQVPEELMPEYFADADLYVSCTGCDGSSVSLLQAIACGVPPIVAAGYGNNEWVTHGKNGWLYPAGDVEALAQAIQQALGTHAVRRSARELNIQIACVRADWDTNFARVLAAYDELLAEKDNREMRSDAALQHR